jgi:hypothetical protein
VKNDSEKNQVTQARLGLPEIVLIAGGVVIILLGIYAMVRPNLLMPAKRETLEIAGQKVMMETRRVVQVPRPLSGLVIVSGAGLILLAMPKRRK